MPAKTRNGELDGAPWLGKHMRVTMHDGRIVEGRLEMFDSHGNVTLSEPFVRLQYPEGEVVRALARIAIDQKHVAKMEEGIFETTA